MLKVLVADNSAVFAASLVEILRKTYDVKAVMTGKAAAQILATFRPDVLILDLMLPDMDGTEIISVAASYGIRPLILGLTQYSSKYLFGAAERCGITYLMLRPCTPAAVAGKLEDILMYEYRAPMQKSSLDECVSLTLDMLGFSRSHTGYRQIIQAVSILCKDPTLPVTKAVYPQIARTFSGTREQVERTIRSAIQASWEKRDDRIWRQYFLPDKDGIISRPSNGEFLHMLVSALCNWE